MLKQLDSILQSQILARTLANNAIKKLNNLNTAAESMQKEDTVDPEMKLNNEKALYVKFSFDCFCV